MASYTTQKGRGKPSTSHVKIFDSFMNNKYSRKSSKVVEKQSRGVFDISEKISGYLYSPLSNYHTLCRKVFTTLQIRDL